MEERLENRKDIDAKKGHSRCCQGDDRFFLTTRKGWSEGVFRNAHVTSIFRTHPLNSLLFSMSKCAPLYRAQIYYNFAYCTRRTLHCTHLYTFLPLFLNTPARVHRKQDGRPATFVRLSSFSRATIYTYSGRRYTFRLRLPTSSSYS